MFTLAGEGEEEEEGEGEGEEEEEEEEETSKMQNRPNVLNIQRTLCKFVTVQNHNKK